MILRYVPTVDPSKFPIVKRYCSIYDSFMRSLKRSQITLKPIYILRKCIIMTLYYFNLCTVFLHYLKSEYVFSLFI